MEHLSSRYVGNHTQNHYYLHDYCSNMDSIDSYWNLLSIAENYWIIYLYPILRMIDRQIGWARLARTACWVGPSTTRLGWRVGLRNWVGRNNCWRSWVGSEWNPVLVILDNWRLWGWLSLGWRTSWGGWGCGCHTPSPGGIHGVGQIDVGRTLVNIGARNHSIRNYNFFTWNHCVWSWRVQE